MEKSQLALKLLLDELGLAPDIKTVRDRKTVQKGVYLAQAAGVDLGYRYNWYRMGPYSPGLTRDYFALDEALANGDDDSPRFELQDAVRARLASVGPLMEVPSSVDLSKSDWLELVASLHYLLAQRRMDPDKAFNQLEEEKRHVARYASVAMEKLHNQGLVDA